MNNLEQEVKELIMTRYGSLKKFCETVDMPWTTLDSILKRGFINSNIGNVLKISKELGIEAEPLALGEIVPHHSSPAPLHLSEQEERLVRSYRQLNGKGQDKLLGYADDLVASGRYGLSELEAQMWKDVDEIAREEYQLADTTPACQETISK